MGVERGDRNERSDHGGRALRVAGALREEIALVLSSDVKDPGAAGAVVTRVEMVADLASARVYVRLLESGADPARREGLLRALGRASGLLRREVTRRLGLRYAPELRFVYDDGLDGAARVQDILAEIEADRRRSIT